METKRAFLSSHHGPITVLRPLAALSNVDIVFLEFQTASQMKLLFIIYLVCGILWYSRTWP